MARLIAALVRHGEYHQRANTPSAHQPFALTPDGIKQAEDGARLITTMAKDNGWAIHAAVQSSNLLRAWQTADIIREKLDEVTHVEGIDDLAERGLGSAANLSLAEIEDVLNDDPRFDAPPTDWKSNSHYQLPLQGAESLTQAGQRVARRIRMTLSALPTGTDNDTMIVFVGHGAAFRHAACELGTLAFGDIAKYSMHYAQPVALEANADGPWRLVAGAWKVRKAVPQDRDLD